MMQTRKALLLAILALFAMAGCEQLPPPEGPVSARAAKPKPPQEDPVEKAVRERRARDAYAIPPRSYAPQSNTTPLGWQPPPAQAAAPQAAPQQPVAAAALPPVPPTSVPSTPVSGQPPPHPADKPPAPASAAPAATPAATSAVTPGGANPPLPAGYVPSVAASAGTPAIASLPASNVVSGNWYAHIASHRSEAAAINDWQRRLKENPTVYGELEPALLWADVSNRGSYARLVFGDFTSKADAQAACSRISGPGRYCNAIQQKP